MSGLIRAIPDQGVNVKHAPFFASGNGVADCSAAFSAASAKAGTFGLVVVPDGNYYLQTNVTSAATFQFASNARLSGPGVLFAPIDATAALPQAKKLADVMNKAHNGGTVTVVCYGDSITYGQDTTGTGTQPAINGATQTRSVQQYPENMQECLSFAGYTPAVTVANKGFPGDTTRDGLTRWWNEPARDVAFIMYGHNDANNYGGTGLVTLADYRRNLSMLVFREIKKGAAVVVLGPPQVADVEPTNDIRAYSLAARQVAQQYGCDFLDMAEILQSVTTLYSDGVHLTSFAYAEMGWQAGALLIKGNTRLERVTPGDFYYPDDQLGKGGPISVGTYAGPKGANRLIQLNPGEVYVLALDVQGDCMPLVHAYSTGGTRQLGIYYAGGGSASRGVPTSTINHNSAFGERQTLPGPMLRKGLRTLLLRNDNGSNPFYIEAIEFVGREHVHTACGGLHKSAALSGAYQPKRYSASLTTWWSAADYSRRLTTPYSLIANLKLDGAGQHGIAIWKNLPVSNEILSADAIFILRDGTSLVIRDFVAGVPSDTTAAGAFSVGVFSGEVHVDVTDTAINVYVDGVLKGTRANPVNKSGYPGFLADKAVALECRSLYFKGAVKGPYA